LIWTSFLVLDSAVSASGLCLDECLPPFSTVISSDPGCGLRSHTPVFLFPPSEFRCFACNPFGCSSPTNLVVNLTVPYTTLLLETCGICWATLFPQPTNSASRLPVFSSPSCNRNCLFFGCVFSRFHFFFSFGGVG